MNGEYAKIGDSVITADGKPAVISGFQEIDYGFIHNDGMLPGIYRNYHIVEIKFKDGTTNFEKDDNLSLASKGGSQHFQSKDEPSIKKVHTLTYDRALPVLPFWEGDLVKARANSRLWSKIKSIFTKTETLIIVRIDYLNAESNANKKASNPCYEISDSFLSNLKTMVKEEDLDLVERGHVWNYYHKQVLDFPNLKDRAEFFHMLGKTQLIKNRFGNYDWNYEEAVEMVRLGSANGIISNSSGKFSLVTFHNKGLGEAIARLTVNNKLILKEI